LRAALAWLGFLIAVPLVLYLLFGGMKIYMDDQHEKIQACLDDGGVVNRYMHCVKL
jgi:hypothetical protein